MQSVRGITATTSIACTLLWSLLFCLLLNTSNCILFLLCLGAGTCSKMDGTSSGDRGLSLFFPETHVMTGLVDIDVSKSDCVNTVTEIQKAHLQP